MGREFQSLSVRKETVDIDIFVTSGNGGRKIMQSIRITNETILRQRSSLYYLSIYYPQGVVHSFSTKKIFYDKMDLRPFYFCMTILFSDSISSLKTRGVTKREIVNIDTS